MFWELSFLHKTTFIVSISKTILQARIFNYLDYPELLLIAEEVCTTWKDIVSTYIWSSVKELSFENEEPEEYVLVFSNNF